MSASRVFTSRCALLALLSVTVVASAPSLAQAKHPAPLSMSFARDADGAFLLQAVAEGSVEKTHAALATGADVNEADKNGKTPLMIAASIGRTDLVQTLLDKGADVNRADKEGRTALHYILAGNAPEAPKKKRGWGGFVDKAKQLGGKAAQLLVHAGPLMQFLPGGPLVQNLAQGLLTQGGAASLLAPGASFALSNGNAWSGVLGSALMSSNGKNNSAALLGAVDGLVASANGSDVDTALAASGWKTLLSSAGDKHPELFKAMGNLGSDATPTERAAWAGFLSLAQSGDEEAMQALIADPSFAPILAKATGGLRLAVDQLPGRDGGTGIVKALLARGANPALTDKHGVTAAQRAKTGNLNAIVALLEPTAAPAE